MSTKVISAKIEPELYDKLLEECNLKGITISQFLKDACIKTMEGFGEPERDNSDLVSELQNKISSLESQLQSARSTIEAKNKQIEDFFSLFSQKEIGQRRFDKAIHSIKLGM